MVEPTVQHLKNVYGCFSVSILAAIAAIFTIGKHLNDILFIAIIATVGSFMFFLSLLIIPDIPDKNRALRFTFLLGYSGFSGINLTNVFKDLMRQNPILILTAFLDTVLIFSALSSCAILSEKGRWLFLGLPMTILLFFLIVVSFANVVGKSGVISKAIIYLSLFAFCGLVLYDTQVILDRFLKEDEDFIRHTMDIFTDFIGIYRRILILGRKDELEEGDRQSQIED